MSADVACDADEGRGRDGVYVFHCGEVEVLRLHRLWLGCGVLDSGMYSRDPYLVLEEWMGHVAAWIARRAPLCTFHVCRS